MHVWVHGHYGTTHYLRIIFVLPYFTLPSCRWRTYFMDGRVHMKKIADGCIPVYIQGILYN